MTVVEGVVRTYNAADSASLHRARGTGAQCPRGPARRIVPLLESKDLPAAVFFPVFLCICNAKTGTTREFESYYLLATNETKQNVQNKRESQFVMHRSLFGRDCMSCRLVENNTKCDRFYISGASIYLDAVEMGGEQGLLFPFWMHKRMSRNV